jgi:putative tryptophan/tyrosine transport system substrate-binding protein
MRRRELLGALGSATLAWSYGAHAQPAERVRRIGVLTFSAESDPEGQSSVAAFREELRKLGWTEGRNCEIEIRWAAADIELMKRFAKELLALQPDLILTSSTHADAVVLQ